MKMREHYLIAEAMVDQDEVKKALVHAVLALVGALMLVKDSSSATERFRDAVGE